MIVLDGKAVALATHSKIKARIEKHLLQGNKAPHLVVVMVGSDPASQVYVRNKHQTCLNIGMRSTVKQLPEGISVEEFVSTIKDLNKDPDVDGILVQLPLPSHLKSELVADIIDPMKDPDGLTYTNLGKLVANRALVPSCTPSGIMSILSHYNVNPKGMRAVVVGRSLIVGKPIFHLLTDAQATVSLCHSHTRDLKDYTHHADLVVVAAGKARHWGREDFKRNSIIIDVGIHRVDGKLCGDVRYEELIGFSYAATPVPGGVGPMTIASLLENTMTLAESRCK